MLMLRDNHFREVQLYFSKIRASKLLESLPTDESRWVESGYAHWINRLVPASEHLPEPQRSWYLRGYGSRYLRSAE